MPAALNPSDVSLAALLADPGPEADQGYDHTDTTLVSLWTTIQTKKAEYTDVSSHAVEGDSYTRDLTRAENLLLQHYQAYLLRKNTLLAATGTHPLLLRTGRSRVVRFDAIALHTL